MATNYLGLGQCNIVPHGVIGTKIKIKPEKKVLKSGNPIPYFEVAESEYNAGFKELGGILDNTNVLC